MRASVMERRYLKTLSNDPTYVLFPINNINDTFNELLQSY